MPLKIIGIWNSCLRFGKRRIFGVLLLFFCGGILGTFFNMLLLSDRLIVAQALESSTVTARAVLEARTLYNTSAVIRAAKIPGISPSHDYLNRSGGIPIPATFLIELSEEIKAKSPDISVRYFSNYPFPWRKQTGGPKDDFERQALKELEINPDRIFSRVETYKGRISFRYAQADIMKASCVSCHNTHPDSPKVGWKIGEMRGVLEISQPLDSLRSGIGKELRGTFSMFGGLSFLGLIGLWLAFRRNRLYSLELAREVKERTIDLEEANDQISALNDQLRSDNVRMGAELNVARHIQQMILPQKDELNTIHALEVSGFMETALEVGGDYYDVIYSADAMQIGIGDVTGHGLNSGILMLMVQTAVKSLLASGIKEPIPFFNILNGVIYENVQRMNLDKNLSLSLLNYHNGEVCLSGQHEEMLVIRQDQTIERIDTIDLGFPIGLQADISPFIDYRIVKLNPGDIIVLYTDGIVEAENSNKEQYGIDRLISAALVNLKESAIKIKERIVLDLIEFIGTQEVFDDYTIVILKQK